MELVARVLTAASRASERGRVREEVSCGWDQGKMEGRKKGGKAAGRREVRGVGTEMKVG